MNRKFGLLLLALLFFVLQPISALHLAAHAFADHKHHGKFCDICLVWEQSKIGSKAVNVPLPVVEFSFIENTPVIILAVQLLEYSSSIPRAPPAALLS